MQSWLFIAEKPSLMRDVQSCYKNHISEVQKAVGKIDFVALSGHVCTNFEPNDYDDWNVPWGKIDYPMIPSVWRIKPIQDDGRLKAIEQVRQEAGRHDGIIVGTDSDTEGYGIYYLLENYLGLQKMKALRFMEHSLTDAEILKSLCSMTDYHEDDVHVRFTKSYLIRARTDWLYGMNCTRMMTNKLQELMTVGRVKAPTIKLVYDNSMAITDFKEKTYFQIQADYQGFSGVMEEDGRPVSIDTREEAEQIAAQVPRNGFVEEVSSQTVTTHAPKLYDLTSIQSEAGQMYGYSPTRTLELVQSLYEKHKVISYPRTQCRYVSAEKAKEFPAMLAKMSVFPELAHYASSVTEKDIARVLKDRQVVNDREVAKESHDALLPTDKTPVLSELTEDETNICSMIYRRLLAEFLPALVEERTKVRTAHGEYSFAATGKRVQTQGWRILYKEMQDAVLPVLNQGDAIAAVDISAKEKKTTPPKRLTQATLISAMKNIANLIKDKELKASLADSQGIGTPATRAKIISDIISRGYVAEKRGALYITSLGKAYIENLATIDIISPTFAAIIDTDIKKIQRGERTYDDVYKKITEDLYRVCSQIERLERRDVLSPYHCPRCGHPLADRRYAYECINEACKKPDDQKHATVKIPKRLCGKLLDQKVLQILFDGKTTPEYSFTKKDGSKFKAKLTMTKDGVAFAFSERAKMKCPCCQAEMRSNRAGYFCDCGFKLFNPIVGKTLTEKEVETLFRDGKLPKSDGFKSKAGNAFSAGLEVNRQEKKVDLVFD